MGCQVIRNPIYPKDWLYPYYTRTLWLAFLTALPVSNSSYKQIVFILHAMSQILSECKLAQFHWPQWSFTYLDDQEPGPMGLSHLSVTPVLTLIQWSYTG